MSWGKGIEKRTPDKVGDLILVGEDADTGRLIGEVKWAEGGDAVRSEKVEIQSVGTKMSGIRTMTDERGLFEVQLLNGSYRISVARSRSKGEGLLVEVEGNRGNRVELQLEDPEGIVIEAGPGRAVTAGPGTRSGLWKSFSIVDGLPSPFTGEDILHDVEGITDILQDSRGDLWFSSGGGICKFDGQTFTNFTMEDGLVHNVVQSILEDRDKNLWFGTDGGVSRFNGSHFTNFTRADGLAGDWIWPIIEDREGNLWFGTDGGVSRYDHRRFTNYTTDDGLAGNWIWSILEDRKGDLWFACWPSGVSRFDGERFYNYNQDDGLASNGVISIFEDEKGVLWFGTQQGLSKYSDGEFTNFTVRNGLANNVVWDIEEDNKGNLWFATGWSGIISGGRYDGAAWSGIGGGVSRFDGEEFVSFFTEDGLTSSVVWSVLQDNNGTFWFGSEGGAISRYDGAQLQNYTVDEGLISRRVNCILEDRQGHLWLGTDGGLIRYDGEQFTSVGADADASITKIIAILEDRAGNIWFSMGLSGTGGGVIRYDGKTFTPFTTKDGLASNDVQCMLEDRSGYIWFGTTRGGVSRYDGANFVSFSKEDGLVHNWVWSILEDRNGHLWFGTGRAGTGGGVSRYDGERFASFTTADGLVSNQVRDILEDRDGHIWFATLGGISRYDGERFTSFTTTDGLIHNWVKTILEDRAGNLWFGTQGGGVSRYNGVVFQNLTDRDGLIDNTVWDLHLDQTDEVWIATSEGLVRYSPRYVPPPVEIVNVIADREYGPVTAIDISTAQKFAVFEFKGHSLITNPDQMVYIYRMQGHDEEWQSTRENRVIYDDLPVGEFTFQVKAVDRDLIYSPQPAQVLITVRLPYGQFALLGGLSIALVGLVITSVYAIRRRQERDRATESLVRELEEELNTAHQMQMGLMPTRAPKVEGYDIAGRCLPASHVGGDFFQYFELSRNRLALVLADVTGHAMEAAIPVVMFSGLLESQMELSGLVTFEDLLEFDLELRGSLAELMERLNRSLVRTLDQRTFICFAIGEIDSAARVLRLANGGCPYPFHYIAADSTVRELEVGNYPLGVQVDTGYEAIEVRLSAGDYVIFCSDGIIEAVNADEDLFGFEQTAETIRQGCAEGLSAEALIDQLIGAVKVFAGNEPQGDDMTCVVLRVDTRS